MNAKTQTKRSTLACSSESGFTLVEIMVVIVILGLLATLVARNVMGASDEARETKAQSDVKMIAGAKDASLQIICPSLVQKLVVFS